jgi:serine/threonine-protein kinase RsbW
MERQAEPDAPPASTEQRGSGMGSDVMVTAPATVTLTLPPQPRFVRVARLVATGLANELGFGVDRLDDVRLAVGEACGLAVQVGARQIELSYVLAEHSLSVTIDAVLDGPAVQLDADYVTLAEQVLAVACDDQRVDRDERRMSIGITFTDAD